jgi:hypothetical protein
MTIKERLDAMNGGNYQPTPDHLLIRQPESESNNFD